MLAGRQYLLLLCLTSFAGEAFELKDATVESIQTGLCNGSLTSRRLVEYYLQRIESLNPLLHAVIEVSPDAVAHADLADADRRSSGLCGGLHGIPVLLKDNIATRDRLNTTAGSLALLGATAPRDAGVVERLRRAGALVLGKASLSEWAHFRSFDAPNGWSARGGQGKNPYDLAADPCGSSSGSAIAAAADLAAVTLGSETDGSILCPSAANSVVGIKPTVGLTSRSGVIPISPRQDTIGPICRTVSDAVHVLEAIAGYDARDAAATAAAVKHIPENGYTQFLRDDGLKGKRLGILRKGFFDVYPEGSTKHRVFARHFRTLKRRGAVLVDNLEIANMSIIRDSSKSGEHLALVAEFKMYLHAYLEALPSSPVNSLADVIVFNDHHRIAERIEDFGQSVFLTAEKTKGIGRKERLAISRMKELSVMGLEALMRENRLDAVVTPDSSISSVLAIGGYPGISVPAGYDEGGIPFGICFAGIQGSEPKLIEIAFGFEQATRVRTPPTIGNEPNHTF